MLANYYIENNNSKEIEHLKLYANSLNSLTKDIILKSWNKQYQLIRSKL